MTEASGGGIAGEHPQMASPALVSPSTADEFNTLHLGLVTVACWRLDDIRFEFDSSFILPEAVQEFRRLGALKKLYPDSPISIFGHADPVGKDDYNKKLSGRRAIAIFAVLTRNTDLWEHLYKNPLGGDDWGLKSTQRILMEFGFYPGPIDGKMGPDTKLAVENFQTENGLGVDGKPGHDTREALYAQYMDRLGVDEEGNKFQYETGQFLGKGADPMTPDGGGGKGDLQGCGEFNPVLLFSKDENKEFEKSPKKDARDAANAPNRRVVIFFFRPGSEIDVDKWPCPRVKEGVKDCKKRFWSDADDRRSFKEERREYKDTPNTMACRFYDRFARRSPCEAGFKEWVLRILETGPTPLKLRKPLANEPYTVTGAGPGDIAGATDANGVFRVRADSDTQVMVVKIAGMLITLDGGALKPVDTDEGVKHRLYNLGYGDHDLAAWDKDPGIQTAAVKQFQKDHDLPEGPVDDATRSKLKEVHGS